MWAIICKLLIRELFSRINLLTNVSFFIYKYFSTAVRCTKNFPWDYLFISNQIYLYLFFFTTFTYPVDKPIFSLKWLSTIIINITQIIKEKMIKSWPKTTRKKFISINFFVCHSLCSLEICSNLNTNIVVISTKIWTQLMTKNSYIPRICWWGFSYKPIYCSAHVQMYISLILVSLFYIFIKAVSVLAHWIHN